MAPTGTKLHKPKRAKTASTGERKTEDAKSVTADSKDMDYTEEQRYWIRFHYYQLNFAVSNRSAVALKETISCAYFNAYYQIYSMKTTGKEIPHPLHPLRTFRDYQEKAEEIFPNLIPQILERSRRNRETEDAKEFRPIITPSCLTTFREIFDRYADNGEFNWGDETGAAEMNKFLSNIVDQQLAAYQPAWLAEGTTNILRRPLLKLAGYTAYHLGELSYCPSGQRWKWHQDVYYPEDPSHYITVSHGPGKTGERLPMVYRAVHADAGNALLNMAIDRPHGYDGDLKALVTQTTGVNLPSMSREQRKEFYNHVKAVKAGDALRKQVFEEAVWPPKAEATDDAARGVFVRKPKLIPIDR